MDQPDKRQQQEYQQEKQKDKFDKKPPLWKRILAIDSGKRRGSALLGQKPKRLTLPTQPATTQEASDQGEEGSLTFTERILVLWGILGKDGKPRLGVILVYALIFGMFIGASFLMIGMILWQ